MNIFDSGYLFCTPPAASGLPPLMLGELQGVETDVNFTLARAPLNMQAAALYTIPKLGFKFVAKLAQLNGANVNMLLFGKAPSAGSQAVAKSNVTTATVGSGPYTATPTVPESGTWAQDLGAQYTTTGVQLVPVVSSPAQGQYTVAAGVYTVNSADAGVELSFNFLYTRAAGSSLVLPNNWQGLAPTFTVVLNNQYDGKQMTWSLNRCVSEDLKIAATVNKFSVPEFTFQALGDGNGTQGNIGTFSFSD